NITADVRTYAFGCRKVHEECSIVVHEDDILTRHSLNSDQKNAYDAIMRHVDAESLGVFFIDGPGGTGKTFLYKPLLVTVCSCSFIALATASSGAAANNMTGGRTAHSRFKIPINLTTNSICNIKKQSVLAKLLCQAKLIIWDEASMAKRQAVGRAQTNPWFLNFLLRVGDGVEEVIDQDYARIPDDMTIPYTNETASKDALINEIFPSFATNAHSSVDIVSRAILSTKYEQVDNINDMLIDRFPGEEKVYYNFDEAKDDAHNYYPLEFLNSLKVNGFLPHHLRLKIGCPIGKWIM
nr:ATP-dependent DNA helicase PIF1-like [Tanacetum cinerariifolium]